MNRAHDPRSFALKMRIRVQTTSPRWAAGALLFSAILFGVAGCQYVRLLRPRVLKQLNPDVVRLVNELPALDHPNREIIARLFPHGGLAHATKEPDGTYRAALLDAFGFPEFPWPERPLHLTHGPADANGDGVFDPPFEWPEPERIAGDIDGDGTLELAVR